VLNREIAAIQDLGVDILTSMRLGDNLSWEQLSAHQAVFLAVGQHQSRRLDISGEDAHGVLPGLEFLRHINLGEPVQVGARVAIVGGGNTAMDAARAALRLGASQVTVLYRRSSHEMPAIAEEVEEAEQEGVRMEYLTAPVQVLSTGGAVSGLRCVRMRLGDPDERGRRRPEPMSGSEYTLALDTVIPALGQQADLSFLNSSVQSTQGLIVIDPTSTTSQQGVFAGGDAATNAGTVADAIGSGKRAALAIDRVLNAQSLEGFPALSEHVHVAARDVDPRVVTFEDVNLSYFRQEPRTPQPQRPATKRARDFHEVNQSHEAQACARRSVASVVAPVTNAIRAGYIALTCACTP